MADGDISWFEINVPDAQRAQAFYGSVFAWGFDPMPGFEGYVLVRAGDRQIGALQASTDPDPAGRHVTLYFEVPDLEGALERARTGGGTVTQERMEVPGNQWIGLVKDPFGTAVGLLTNNPAAA